MWYGKGPGVDRCGDVFKHANAAGTSKHGGVLVLAGDDHAAKSSTLPHQSEHIFKACLIPVLNPSSVQDYLDLGLHGFAMSRYSGCWVAFKCVTDVVESGASVDRRSGPRQIAACPQDFALPPRRPEHPLARRHPRAGSAHPRLQGLRRARLLRAPTGSTASSGTRRSARLGIVTTGKSFGDVMQALADLGIDERVARDIGLRVYKVGDDLAARAAGRAALRRGPGRNPGGRGEAPAHRVPDQGRALQLEGRRARAARGRQVRRQRRVEPQRRPAGRHLAAAGALRAFAGDGGAGDRAAPREAGHDCDSLGASSGSGSRSSTSRRRCSPSRASRRSASPTSAPAARTTPRPACPKAAAPPPASAATSWRCGWTATPRPSRTWAAKARPGSGRRRSPTRSTSSPTSATAPTSTPACSRSAPRWRPRST